MTSLMWTLLATHVLVPLALLAWVAWGRPQTRAARTLGLAASAAYLLAIGIAGMWLVPPWYTPFAYALLLAGALGLSWRRRRTLAGRPRGLRAWLAAVAWGAAAVSFTAVALYALAGRGTPANTVNLELPLASGTYYVASGGANRLLNFHFLTLNGERYRPFRGQSYGVDVMKLDWWGLRARGIAPSDPAAYAIWGEPVYAPCAGTVIEAVDGRPDMRPPTVDREYLPGNNVLLDCGRVWVLLAHFQNGSVQVRSGDTVTAGQWLGRVGNSGNTGEPHLHVHAQRQGTAEEPGSGEPLHIRFDGRFLARNSRVRGVPRDARRPLSESVSGILRISQVRDRSRGRREP
jgi:murein DD-endopeptidase MepM/ murein hydrolase activator NlpD